MIFSPLTSSGSCTLDHQLGKTPFEIVSSVCVVMSWERVLVIIITMACGGFMEFFGGFMEFFGEVIDFFDVVIEVDY